MTEHQRERNVTDSAYTSDPARIEELILDLSEQPGAITSLMREHLEAARFYLIASMPQEYAFNLTLAKQLLTEIENKHLKSRIANFLQSEEAKQGSRVPSGKTV
jgi:hypothetical protein